MAVKELKLKDLAATLKAEPKRQLPQIKAAVREGVLRSIPELTRNSPIDTGLYASSWDFSETEESLILGNSAPHAAIIENGARPFTPPITPLLQWAKRVLKDPSQPPDYSPEVRGLAYGVQAKIKAHGMRPRNILAKEMPNILKRIKKEFRKLE